MREFIVEADGGSRGNPGPAGYGSVVIDAATGETLVEVAEYIGIATNNVAEYRGLIAGLRAAHQLDPDATVHVRMDSKLVVEQMSGRWKIKHPDMKPLAAEAAKVFSVVGQVTYEWIPRGRNKHADRLANEAMDAGKRGEQWSASTSTAELDAGVGSTAADADTGAATKVAAGWSAPADLGPPATFVLLRHGETLLTPQKRFSGSGGTDPSLSDVGRDQAERVAESLARRGTIEAIVASPLARTRQTAAAVATRLGLDVTVDDGLRETDFGAWEGLTFGEVRERYPDDMNAWLASPKAEPTGGGESFAATARRMAVTRDKLIAAHAGRTVLLVTHVTPIKTLVRLALGAPPESLFRMELSAASLSAIAYYTDGNASVRLFNDTSHLS
ncbi:bifunctional RNase H/acid phosphatase [Streptomyces turgidiscabies]|uniref:Ribonuclease HI n=1 Tax=Streptomyces turgidiscabies (strain Car8) TaxID=698760 RepID=L7F0R3_STRT8|nr:MULTISPECIES: bifunctional RNase H/acid phosphatase [Streptomyces]ELP64887.1 ribonuclease HI [Streptomyces turgidiscabies Car8]MDX3494317.1 bifunctional RNase H/acid phosphatase [Streptomyces turgidiscabies]GAQ68308.1 phosphoserine phosphatase 1 [Streptomyces turgidiscabies]